MNRRRRLAMRARHRRLLRRIDRFVVLYDAQGRVCGAAWYGYRRLGPTPPIHEIRFTVGSAAAPSC